MGLGGFAVNAVPPLRHVAPRSAEEVRDAVRAASDAGEALVAFGGRTRLEVGNAPRRYDVALDLSALGGVVEHEPGDLTATVRAGTTLGDLARALSAHGQMWPVEVARPDLATVGGVLAGAAPGPSRLRYAHPRDWTLGVRAVTGEGTLTRAGGKVVKNVSGYDLTRFYAGTYGTLCVLVEASLKLWPLPEAERTLLARLSDVREAREALAILRRDAVDLDAAVSADAAAAEHVGEASALAVVRLRGARPVVARNADRVARALGPRTEEARPGLLAELADAPLRARVALRVAAPESRMVDALGGEVGSLRYDGAGLAFLLRAEADAEWVATARTRVERLEGSAVLERAPQELRARVDTWGTPVIPAALSARIKSALDPNGTLAPGRFAGGI